MSHPMWVRGLKQKENRQKQEIPFVAPYVGAWIETSDIMAAKGGKIVAPYVGAWIETKVNVCTHNDIPVAPYVGAWIETCAAKPPNLETLRRTLCGCVD